MLKVLLVLAVIAVVVLVVRGLRRGGSSGSDDPAARSGKLAADTAHISRQGGQGMGQGGVGGGFGP